MPAPVFMDAQVGKLLKALEESGQMDNTLIVFMGDHGYHLGEHNWWNKVTIFEKGTNAPFIIAGNAAGQKGVETDAMFEFIDIYPTLAELMGLKNVPDYLEGRSFSEVLKNPSLPFRSSVRADSKQGCDAGQNCKNRINGDIRNGITGIREMNSMIRERIRSSIIILLLIQSYSAVVAEMKKLLYQKN